MIPLVLVTGFLGSGKTTLLRNIATSPQGRDVVFLVNEFSELNIDSQRLSASGVEIFEVTGGSLFCECKVEDFLANLTRIKEHFENTERALRGVVIETSGIADPTVMTKLLCSTGNDTTFEIAQIFALVSPIRFFDLLESYPNLRAQIECSDSVLVNKIDLATEPELNLIKERILAINPSSSVTFTHYAQTNLPIWQTPHRNRPQRGNLSTPANPYLSLAFPLKTSVSESYLQSILSANQDVLLRAKGSLGNSEAPIRFDYSSGIFSTEPEPNPSTSPQCVLIVDESHEEAALKLRSHLSSLG